MKIGRLFIDGGWFETDKKTNILNPTRRESIGQICIASVSDVQMAVKAAKDNFDNWRNLSYKERGRYLTRLKEIILKERNTIVELINKETGRPLVEIIAQEIISPLMKVDFLIKNTERFLKQEKIRYFKFGLSREKSFIVFEPLGVIGIILPKTNPLSLPLNLVAATLMAGNTIVLKPSEFLSFCWLKIAELFQQINFPKGVLNIILGGKEVGEYLIDSGVNKIFFIGKTDTGRSVMERAANKLTPLCLELGGNSSFIVLDDANLELATDAAVRGAFINSGQYCASVKNVFVVEKVAKDFVVLLKNKTVKLTIGDGASPGVDVGPLIDESFIRKLKDCIEDAISKGASVLCGGKQLLDKNGFFFPPTILADVDCSMKIMQEEILGPILSILKIKDENEAISLTNHSGYGLSASIWTKDLKKATRIAKMLDVGTVWINNTLFLPPAAPWGGVKKSGFGRIGSRYGLLELVNIKHINISRGRKKQSSFPYSPYLLNFYNVLAPFLLKKGIFKKISSLRKLIKILIRHKISTLFR